MQHQQNIYSSNNCNSISVRNIVLAIGLLAATASGYAATTVAGTAVGSSTDTSVIEVGVSNTDGGPHKSGYIGFGFNGTIIDFDGINNYSTTGSSITVDGTTFTKYYLPGYSHSGEGGTITTAITWYKVPSISNEVYFGYATDDAGKSASYYIGDTGGSGYAVPSSATTYATAGALLYDGGTYELTGNLDLTTGSSTKIGGNLNSLTSNHYININASASSSGATTFTGSSELFNGSTSISAGSSSVSFYGGGTTGITSSIAGSASGTGYTASFGGIAK